MCAGYFAPRIFMIEVGVFGTDRHVLSQNCCFLQIMDALMILSVFFSSALVLFGSGIYYRRLSSYNPKFQKMSEQESSKLSKKCARNAGKNRQNKGKKNVVKHKGKTAPKCDGPISQKPSGVTKKRKRKTENGRLFGGNRPRKCPNIPPNRFSFSAE